MKNIRVGIIGYGGVGKSFIRLIKNKEDYLKKMGLILNIIFILKSDGGIYSYNGINLSELINTSNDIDEANNINNNNNNISAILNKKITEHKLWNDELTYDKVVDKNIDLLIEVTPTNIKTGEPALSYIREALGRKINVITANKGPILKNYKNLKKLAEENKVTLGIGCTTGGALPSINGGVIECAGAEINSIEGILNGTTNYILSQMLQNNVEYDIALKKAQSLGIAETDPTLDVEGFDTAIKMIILSNVLLGTDYKLEDVSIKGINNIKLRELQILKGEGKKIKLIGRATDNFLKVEPKIIDNNYLLYNVDNKNKGIIYNTDTLGEIAIIGGASGTGNAAASILRDIINIYTR